MTPGTLVIPLALSLLTTSLLPCTTVADDEDSLSARGSGNQISLQSTTTWIEHSGTSAPAVARPLAVEPVPVVVCGLTGRVVAGASGERSAYRLCPPAPPAEDGAPLVVTASDVSTLLVGGSGLVRQPPGDQVIITKDLIVHTDPSPRTLVTTVAGTPVTITATPISYTWHWGDATSTTTTDPGRPYPNQTVVHRYQQRGTHVLVSLTTTWSATYTLEGQTTARPVAGTITTTETSTPFTLIRLTSILTDDAEEAMGH